MQQRNLHKIDGFAIRRFDKKTRTLWTGGFVAGDITCSFLMNISPITFLCSSLCRAPSYKGWAHLPCTLKNWQVRRISWLGRKISMMKGITRKFTLDNWCRCPNVQWQNIFRPTEPRLHNLPGGQHNSLDLQFVAIGLSGTESWYFCLSCPSCLV